MEELSKKVNKLNQDPEIIDIIIENEDEIIKNTMYEKVSLKVSPKELIKASLKV